MYLEEIADYDPATGDLFPIAQSERISTDLLLENFVTGGNSNEKTETVEEGKPA